MTEEERKLWIESFTAALSGFFKNNKWAGIEVLQARDVADKSVEEYRKVSK